MARKRKNKEGVKHETKEGQEKDEIYKLLEMKTSNILGRYLVAKEDIKPGTVILRAEPLVLGPDIMRDKPLCLACYKPIDDINNCKRCNGCEWPLCSSNCNSQHQDNGHSELECQILKKSRRKPKTNKDYQLFNFILPLRVASLKLACTQKWAEVQKMQCHTKDRKKNTILWNSNQEIIDCMRKECGINEFTDQELHSIFGYLQINSFAVEHLGISALYPYAFLFAHDCIPNTTHLIDNKFCMIVRATTLIKKGDPVTLSYTNTLQGTLVRRSTLKEAKYFDCSCKRCSDPTEIGTFMSAIKCEFCKNGYLLPIDSLDSKSVWRCSCTFERNSEYISTFIESISKQAELMKTKGIKEMEDFLKKYSSSLHQNHYVLVSIKCLLSQLYGKLEGYLIQDLTKDLLNRKIEICKSLLKIFDIVEPGLSRIRGITAYELHAPLMINISQKYQTKQCNNKMIKSQLKQVLDLLTEASLILSFESVLSKEGQMGSAAKQALDQTKDWEKQLGRL